MSMTPLLLTSAMVYLLLSLATNSLQTANALRTITPELTPSMTPCRTYVNISRNWTCPKPKLSNITQPPFINGSWDINKFNKSWDINWWTEYNQSIDGTGECGVITNPKNKFSRTCTFPLACNLTNITNGSVTFYNFSVYLKTPGNRLDTQILMDAEFYKVSNNQTVITSVFAMNNYTIGSTYNNIWPNLGSQIPRVPLGGGYVITSNWTETALIRVRLYTADIQNGFPYQNNIGINFSAHFECDQNIVNITVYGDGDYQGLALALGLPLAILFLILLLGCLKYKYPELFSCCCSKKKDGDDNFDNDEAILAAARAKREGRDLEKPMVEFQDKAGMQTWLDQAEDVVEDLNKNCVYLEEAKADSQMQKFDILEGKAAADPTMAAHKEGFIGGRGLYATGAASGGVKVIDHRPTMQTKGGGDDIVL